MVARLNSGALQTTKLRLGAPALAAIKEAIDRHGRVLQALMAR